MKTVLSLCISLLSLTSLPAQISIETQSITLDNLITFVANHFPKEVDVVKANANNIGEKKLKQISFIIETSKSNFAPEDKIIIQQAFKFLSTRLSKDDTVSLFVYAGQNGLLLDRVSAKDLKKIVSAINDVNSSITEKHTDGITMAYQQAQEHFNETANNIVVMVRNPNAVMNKPQVNTTEINVTAAKEETTRNKGGSVVLLTAITLLPEIISIIKD